MDAANFISSKLSDKENTNKFVRFARTVAVISVMLGTTALIISLAILNGFDRSLRNNAVKFTSHITVKSFKRTPLPDKNENILKLKQTFPEITGIETILEGECLFRANDDVEGMILRGVDPNNDTKNFAENMIEGKYQFSSLRSKEILISKTVAERMKLNIGDDAVIFAIKFQNTNQAIFPKVTKAVVTGIYETGMTQYDENVLFMPYETVGKLMDIPQGSVTKYEIDLKDIDHARIIADSIDRVLGYPHFALTVFDIHRAIFSWIELQKEPIPLILGLISIVAVLNIITTLLILVVEKTKTIGILRALGMTKLSILKIFVLQGLKLGARGTAYGVILAITFSVLQNYFGLIRLNGELYFLDKLPVFISFEHYFYVALISMLLSFIATFLPSFIAVRISPLKAIRLK